MRKQKNRWVWLLAMMMVFTLLTPGPGIRAASSVALSEKNFPDKIFRDYLSSYDKNKDGKLSTAELKKINWLTLYDEVDLTGIQYLTYLTHFQAKPKNKTLDLRKNKALQEVSIEYADSLETLKLAGLKKLSIVYIKQCANLKKLDVSKCSALKELTCLNGKLKSLDVSSLKKLEWFVCEGNQLTKLDVSKNTKLTTLNACRNKLTNIKTSKKFVALYVYENKLKTLDVSKMKSLKFLEAGDNKLANMNVTKNSNLETLMLHNNNLQKIDISKNKKLERLDLGKTKISSINLSKQPSLEYLDLSYTKVKKLNISKNKLNWINIYKTPLKSLDIRKMHYSSDDIAYITAYVNLKTKITLPNAITPDNNAAKYVKGKTFTPTKKGCYELHSGKMNEDWGGYDKTIEIFAGMDSGMSW